MINFNLYQEAPSKEEIQRARTLAQKQIDRARKEVKTILLGGLAGLGLGLVAWMGFDQIGLDYWGLALGVIVFMVSAWFLGRHQGKREVKDAEDQTPARSLLYWLQEDSPEVCMVMAPYAEDPVLHRYFQSVAQKDRPLLLIETNLIHRYLIDLDRQRHLSALKDAQQKVYGVVSA